MEYTEKELEQERWKPIFGYDGMYEVSDLGRVRSLKFGKTRVLSEQKHTDGYLLVALCKDGKRKNFFVHRLVASAFVENDNLFNTEINHINERKSDNRVSNIEWCDRSYNVSYNGLRKKQHHPQAKRDKVKDLYNPNLTYKQNLELFMANGIECSTMLVYKLRKELGLIKK